MNGATNDYGVNHDGQGNLRGYAWSDSIGWITFEDIGAPHIDLRSGVLTGHAWSASMGWIAFSNLSYFVQSDSLDAGADMDGDGMPDSWELEMTGSTNILTYSGDYDGDTVPDRLEYASGTNPTNPASLLEITKMEITNGTDLIICWASVPTRTYRLQRSTNLLDSSVWSDSGLGLLAVGTNPESTQQVSGAVSTTQGFYRVKAVVPLSE